MIWKYARNIFSKGFISTSFISFDEFFYSEFTKFKAFFKTKSNAYFQ